VKVLLLSAYAARSHVHWQQSLYKMFPQWHWSTLSLPPRHFSWRIRGNALYWAMRERPTLEQVHDVLIATSMVDLATLRGLVPSLARVPTALYFHENQFDYPQHRQQHSLLEAQITSLYSALAADRVLFNSQYNLSSFMEGCSLLLGTMPDRVPPAVVPTLAAKSEVLPVPLDLPAVASTGNYWPGKVRPICSEPLRIVWVGRFEHDKGADGLLRILQLLEERGVQYELALTGQQFRQAPEVFDRIRSEFAHRVVHFGYFENYSQYLGLLCSADLALSTALHEFQGLAMMEAVAQGCLPVVPDRLVYPEIYPARFRYASRLQDPEQEARSAAALILELAENLARYRAQPAEVSAFGLQQLTPRYEQVLMRLAAGQDSQ
jgi:glycosyltransferase involved in cell wall biosynthesis